MYLWCDMFLLFGFVKLCYYWGQCQQKVVVEEDCWQLDGGFDGYGGYICGVVVICYYGIDKIYCCLCYLCKDDGYSQS